MINVVELVSSLPLTTLLEKNTITECMYNTKFYEEVFWKFIGVFWICVILENPEQQYEN